MAEAPRIKILAFTSASPEEQDRGLIGWLSLDVNALLTLDGIVLRQTRDGHLALSFPERRDSKGRRHPLVRPVDDEARRAIEGQIFDALRGRGDLP